MLNKHKVSILKDSTVVIYSRDIEGSTEGRLDQNIACTGNHLGLLRTVLGGDPEGLDKIQQPLFNVFKFFSYMTVGPKLMKKEYSKITLIQSN